MENQNVINFNPDLLPLKNHAVVDTLKTFSYGNIKIAEIIANNANNSEMDLSLVHFNCFESGIEMIVDKVNILAEFCLKSKLGDDIDCKKPESKSTMLLVHAQLKTKCFLEIGKRAVGKGWTDIRDEKDETKWRCNSVINGLDFDNTGRSKSKNFH